MEREQNPLTFVTHISGTIHFVNGVVEDGPAKLTTLFSNQEIPTKPKKIISVPVASAMTGNTRTICGANKSP